MATRVFAVDLGAWSVKLAIASPGIRGAMLLSVVERLLPPPQMEGESTESRAKRALAELIRELRLEHETGYVGVYGDQVFTQVLEFGFKNLRRSELDKAVGGELEGVVPVDLEDMVYTYAELPPNTSGPVTGPGVFAAEPTATGMTSIRGRVAPPADGMRVLTYAMPRERAEELIAFGKETGFEVRGVLACGGAAAKLVSHVPSLARARSEGAVAVIDVGHERTDVVIVAGGKPVFSRSVARAGKQVTEAIARHWKLPWEDAERAKHSDGFIASQTEPATSESWARIHQVLIGELQPFARDLRQTFAACRAKTGFTPMAAIVVGGGSRLRGMASFLSEQLGVPTWRLAQDDVLSIAGPKLGDGGPTGVSPVIDSAAMTIGMAYDAAGGRPMFDLRSGSLAVKMDLSFIRAKAVPLGAAVLVIAAFAAVSAYADLYRLRKAEKTLTSRVATESAEVFQGKSKTTEEILEMTAPGGGTRRASPMPKLTAYDLLLEISSKVPAKDKIALDVDQLKINDTQVEISGYVKTPEQVDDLYNALKEIKCFKKDGITRGGLETEGELKKFKLTIASQCM